MDCRAVAWPRACRGPIIRFFEILDTKPKICIQGKLYEKLLIITLMESAINKEQKALLIHAVKTGFGINNMDFVVA